MPLTCLTLKTRGQGLYEFTDQVTAFVRSEAIDTGLCTAFVRHTSCSRIIQENADPDVQVDLKNFFARLVPPTTDPAIDYLIHRQEGSDDMLAHIKAALTQTLDRNPGQFRAYVARYLARDLSVRTPRRAACP